MRRFLGMGISVALLGTGCTPGFEVQIKSNESAGAVTEPEAPPGLDLALGICSKLDFSNVAWPTAFRTIQKRTMALALNITGSFEGPGGWSNLANNFDGQGISLGLNQQNLGQGTLQPILLEMIEKNEALAATMFSADNLKSMTAMLKKWSQSVKLEKPNDEKKQKPDLFPNRAALSPLDEGFELPEISESASASPNQVSVAWAVATVFLADKSTFKTDWRQSLTTFSETAPYRSLQIEAAAEMFERAVGYFFDLGFQEQRSLLLMYDFVVQNGGFNSDHLDKFKKFDIENPAANETTRLRKLLEIRLVSVRDRFRADVASRKETIINGLGRVHGRDRNLQQEYCFAPTDVIRSGPVLSQP